MRNYRLTFKGKLVFGGLLLLFVSLVAYGFTDLNISNAAVQHEPQQSVLLPTTIPVPQKNLYNLKEFLSYIPETTEKSASTDSVKEDNAGVPAEIFYIPHPDDELLSMGVAIAKAVSDGKIVHVVLFSHGFDTGALPVINGLVYCKWHKKYHNPLVEGYQRMTPQQIGKQRVQEFTESVADLGVKRSNIHILNFNADSVSAYEISLIMLGMEKQFPAARHNASSYKDAHPFHQKVGQALLNLYHDKEVSHACFFISPVQWSKLPGTMIQGDSLRTKLMNSMSNYLHWEPSKSHFAIGYHSYQQPFVKLQAELGSKYHDPDQ